MIKAGGKSAAVDTDLFAQEQAGAEEEEPEFDWADHLPSWCTRDIFASSN